MGSAVTKAKADRSTGTAAASYLLVPPGSQVQPSGDATVIHFPTDVGTIVGRWAVNGEGDLAVMRALQAGLTLTPTVASPGNGLPAPDPAVPEEIAFFEQMRVWMQAFRPARRDLAYQSRFEVLGLFEVDSPFVDPGRDMLSALRDGLAQGREQMEQALRSNPSPVQNGWMLTYHVFDYNLDFFEVGTVDDDERKVEDQPRARYLLRAGAARGGLWGNHGYEAAYAMVYVDSDGHQLNGGSRYQLHFETAPPVGAFWSVATRRYWGESEACYRDAARSSLNLSWESCGGLSSCPPSDAHRDVLGAKARDNNCAARKGAMSFRVVARLSSCPR